METNNSKFIWIGAESHEPYTNINYQKNTVKTDLSNNYPNKNTIIFSSESHSEKPIQINFLNNK